MQQLMVRADVHAQDVTKMQWGKAACRGCSGGGLREKCYKKWVRDVGHAQEGSALGRKEPLVHVAKVIVGVNVSYVDVDVADMRRMLQKYSGGRQF